MEKELGVYFFYGLVGLVYDVWAHVSACGFLLDELGRAKVKDDYFTYYM